jgi:hypothetical protein
MQFKVGDVVRYDRDPCEMVSWRDSETGALVAGPPGCPVTIEAVNEQTREITVIWFYPGFAELQRETFPSGYFIKANHK